MDPTANTQDPGYSTGAGRDEVVFITGGATGVGLASARLLVARGAAVALFDRPGAGTKAAATELGAAAKALAFEGEIADAQELSAAIDAAAAELGPITSVVAAAAADVPGELEVLDDEHWSRAVDDNLTGVFMLAKRAFPQLVATRGAFVAVTSLAGVRSWPGQPASAATMHGIVGLVKTLGQDYGHQGVRSNVVCAGGVETDGSVEGALDVSQIPFGRFARPEEVAAVVAHLTSEDSSYTNAAVQTVDGGAGAGIFAPDD